VIQPAFWPLFPSPAFTPHERPERAQERDGPHHVTAPQTAGRQRWARQSAGARPGERNAPAAPSEARHIAHAAAAAGACSASPHGAPARAATFRHRGPSAAASPAAPGAAGCRAAIAASCASDAAAAAPGCRAAITAGCASDAAAAARRYTGPCSEISNGPHACAAGDRAKAPGAVPRAGSCAEAASGTGTCRFGGAFAGTENSNRGYSLGARSRSAAHATAATRFAAPAPSHTFVQRRRGGALELPRFRRPGGAEEGDRSDQHSATAGGRSGADGEDGEDATVDRVATSSGAQSSSGGRRTANCAGGPRRSEWLSAGYAGCGPAPRLLGYLRRFDRHFAYPDLELLCVTYG